MKNKTIHQKHNNPYSTGEAALNLVEGQKKDTTSIQNTFIKLLPIQRNWIFITKKQNQENTLTHKKKEGGFNGTRKILVCSKGAPGSASPRYCGF